MNELLTALGFTWRSWDGRNSAPRYWNVYIYLGLLTILGGYVYLEYMTTLQAFGIYAVVLTYLLTGYRSLTIYWVVYLLKRFKMNFDEMVVLYRYKVECPEHFVHNMSIIEKITDIKLQKLHNWYESDDKGFASWHMAYRYVIAGCMICAILDNWNAYYLVACSLSGASFPLRVRWWNTEASARLTEGLLGAVMMGWVWLI